MQTSLKKILLAVTIVVPVLTYVFLRSFGDNRYQLPVFYVAEKAVANCVNLTFPHVLDWQMLSIEAADANIFYFPAYVSTPDFYRQLERVTNKFDGVEVFAVMNVNNATKHGTKVVIVDDADFQYVMNCQLIVGEGVDLASPPSHKIVLVDKFGQIRGYYIGSDFDDMDRLELELKILFTEYEY